MEHNLIQEECDRIQKITTSPEYVKLQYQWQESRHKYGLHHPATIALRDKILEMKAQRIVIVS